MAEAIAALEVIGTFPLSMKLHLCSHYRITSWFLPTLRQFLALPTKDYTKADHVTLGPERMHAIGMLKGELDYFYKALLSNTCPILHVCEDDEEKDCQAEWNALFQDILSQMCHPDSPISDQEAERLMTSLVDGNRLCFRFGAEKVVKRGTLVQDKKIVADGLQAIAASFGFSTADFPELA